MRFSSSSVVLACASIAAASPLSLPEWKPKLQHCDVSHLQQPASSLPAPGSGLKLAAIAIGRGTQNYTCAGVASSAPPTAAGAVATLFDFSCYAAAKSPSDLNKETIAIQKLSRDSMVLKNMGPVAAHHYFSDATTPVFAADKFDISMGTSSTRKVNSTAAPADAKNAVPWLKLVAAPGSQGAVQEVYRLQTADGAAPATCGSQTGAFTVEYAAEYWFYTRDDFAFKKDC